MASLPPTQIHEDSEADGEPRTWAVVLSVLGVFAVLALVVLGLRWLDRCPNEVFSVTIEESMDGPAHVTEECVADLLPQPAAGPPTKGPPHPIATTLTVQGRQVTDADEITGSCLFLFLWSEAGASGEWRQIQTIGERTELLTGGSLEGAEGNIVFCPLGGMMREAAYDLTLGDLSDGWYAVCNLFNQCSEPFEIT